MNWKVFASTFLLLAPFARGEKVPSSIALTDGSSLKGVTAVTQEDGKLRIVHEGGISRHALSDVAPSSQVELGLAKKDPDLEAVLKLARIETLEGKVYEEVRTVRIKPSHISFVHRDGASSVKFENLPEDLRRKCRFDPAIAAEYERLRTEQEAIIAKAEALVAKMKQLKAQEAAERKRRQQALWAMEYTSYGSNSYWSGSIRERQLQDAMAARHFRDSGYSAEEAALLMNYYRFR